MLLLAYTHIYQYAASAMQPHCPQKGAVFPMKRLNGIRLPRHKQAEDQQITPIPLPELIRLPMQMHTGTPCVPAVKTGDYVYVGQVVGRAEAEDAVPVHASVSGTVSAVSTCKTASGDTVSCVEIRPDGRQLLDDSCQPPQLKKKDDLIRAVKASGCVGLSGAGDPTHVKLDTSEKIDMLILNGAECEPYLSADSRLMNEHPEDIVNGAALLMKLLKIKETRIGITTDKPAAVKKLTELCKSQKNISVAPLPPLYPQGAEKVLIYHCCGRVVPENQTSAQLGVIVLNVSTCAFIYQYSQTGIPLVERVVTVAGDTVKKPCNLRVPVGTPMRALLEYAACDFAAVRELLDCGPMTGSSLTDPDAPVLRQQNTLLAMKRRVFPDPTACIRCGRCMHACPMNLMPMKLDEAFGRQNIKMLTQYHVSLCIQCGACTYVCPAHRNLSETIQQAKALMPHA